MIVYRVVREKYKNDLYGEGAKLYGGRWNPIGCAVLYTAASKPLGVLELLVHITNNKIPTTYKIVHIEIPFKNLTQIPQIEKLPKDWREQPGPDALKNLGEELLVDQNNLAIQVPSTILPSEYNIILNPTHRDFKKIRILEIEDFELDARLVK